MLVNIPLGTCGVLHMPDPGISVSEPPHLKALAFRNPEADLKQATVDLSLQYGQVHGQVHG